MTTIAQVSPVETQLVPVFVAQIGGITAHVCKATALHAFLEVATKFSDWIKDRIAKYEFQEGHDFAIASEKSEAKRGGHNRMDYLLCLDMAKELSMVENNAKGREARRYFIAMERKALESAGQVAPAVPQPIPATIDFEGTTLRVIERDGAPWLAASTLAAALGEGLHLVQNTFHRNRGQFAGMSAVIRDGRTPQVRIFSVWGVYLLCLLIHTPRAARLREWTRTVLDTLGALGGSRLDRPTPAPTLLPSPVDSLTTPAVRAAINRKAHALSLAAFEHNREILEAWLCRCGDLTDPATAIERIHTLELDHGKHAIVDIQLLCEVTRLTGVLERTVAQQQQAIARLSAVTGRQFQ
ncbi:antA/AntB antirepressor family protein [Lamprocystis purpurea]|jgi:phage anti-repressor protein|uniref:antA/AntB antirepressor family protein n=1 Tax=Lamprocystis purpurea TaxID=61598 RepID=UPI000369F942|nr:antA/AntB antirepressor family protein [Lamprocystis purpurea]